MFDFFFLFMLVKIFGTASETVRSLLVWNESEKKHLQFENFW